MFTLMTVPAAADGDRFDANAAVCGVVDTLTAAEHHQLWPLLADEGGPGAADSVPVASDFPVGDPTVRKVVVMTFPSIARSTSPGS